MATQKKTIRLLILEDSQNEAERLTNLFRNAGHSTRMQRITDEEELLEALSAAWDLFLVAANTEALDPEQATAMARQQAPDLPIIRLLEDNDPDRFSSALLNGAYDAAPDGEDERLLIVAKRELDNLSQRRALREAEIALKEAEKRCELLLDSSVDAIAYVHEGMHIYANRSYQALFAYDEAEDLEGLPITDLIAASDQALFKDFLKSLGQAGKASELNCQGLKADGSNFAMHIQCSPANYDGESCIQTIIRAETDSAELAEKLRELSSLDLVTGLYNRSYALEQLEQAAERAVRADQQTALAYMRIDRYSTLQTELGVTGLDLLLADIAQLLAKHLPGNTILTRFSDDTFCALLPEVSANDCVEPLQKLVTRVEGYLFEINGRTVQTGLSIGLVGINETCSNAEVALQRAARCAEQVENGSGLKLFNPKDELAAAASRGDQAAVLKKALENNEFVLMFQPIISLRGATTEFYEVLLRLNNAQGEDINPRELIQSALETGFAGEVDRWILLSAIEHLVAQRSSGKRTSLFVTVSSASIQDPEFLPWFNSALKSARLEADALIIQIVEADAVTYLKPAKTFTHGLAQLHCKVALSQFGQSKTCMNTLKHLHVDFIKVAASFAQALGTAEGQNTLRQLLEPLHSANLHSIVPMVESATTLSVLWQAGAHYIQGHYLQAPTAQMNYDFAGNDE